MRKRFYWLSYYIRSKHTLKLSQVRDGGGICSVAAFLGSRGYSCAGMIPNLPGAPPLPGNSPDYDYEKDFAFLTSSDLLVLVTRPPMDDASRRGFDLRQITVKRSYSPLENRIFLHLRKYFERCSRDNVTLSAEMASQLKDGFENRAAIAFKPYKRPWYKAQGPYNKGPVEQPIHKKATAAYLLYTEHLWINGPGLLATFGISGPESLAWNYLLTTQHADLLQCPIFAMVEMTAAELPKRPTSLAFADHWNIERTLEHRL